MKGDFKTIVAIILVVVAVVLVGYRLVGPFMPGRKAAPSPIASSAPSPASSTSSSPNLASSSLTMAAAEKPKSDYEMLIAKVTERDLAYKGHGFRNPMAPLVSEPSKGTSKSSSGMKVRLGSSNALALGYSIQGIIWNEVDPLALVNNQVVGVGERLDDGALITEITRDTVRFTKKGNKYFLVFREE